MSGTIIDGWEFVWAAFIITWTALATYGGILVWREHRSHTDDSGSST